jgi:hypothetical protein
MTSANAAKPNASAARTFERLAAQAPAHTLRRTSGVYEFDILDGGQWFLKLDHGNPTIEPKAEHPDCTISCISRMPFVALQPNLHTELAPGQVSPGRGFEPRTLRLQIAVPRSEIRCEFAECR